MQLDVFRRFGWLFEWLQLCERVAPDAEARHSCLVWLYCKAHGLERLDDTPERATGDERRRCLDHDRRIGFQFRSQQIVEACCVEFSQCKVVWIREIDYCNIERGSLDTVEPNERVSVCDVH